MGVFRIGRGGSRVQTGSNVNGNDYDSEEPEASLWYSRTARLAGASLSRVCEAAILCLMLGLVLHSMKGLSFQAKHVRHPLGSGYWGHTVAKVVHFL